MANDQQTDTVQIIRRLLQLYGSRMKKQADYERELRLRAASAAQRIVGKAFGGGAPPVEDPEFELNLVGRTIARTSGITRARLIKALPDSIRAKVQERMYSFEDIRAMRPLEVQRLLMNLDPRTVALALAHADTSLVGVVMRNVSRRTAALYRDELSYLDAPEAEEIQEARKQIAAKMAELAGSAPDAR